MTTITFTFDESICHYFSISHFRGGYGCFMAADPTQFYSNVYGRGYGATPQEAATAAEQKLRASIERELANRTAYKAALTAIHEISLDDFNL